MRSASGALIAIGALAGALVTGTAPVGAADLVAPPPIPGAPAPVPATLQYGRFTFIEENDFLQPGFTDRHYTQGAMLTYLSPLLAPTSDAAQFAAGMARFLPILQPGGNVKQKFSLVAGQSIFTPISYRTFPLNPKDRPFAGWLYTGGSLLQETNGNMLENFELLVGTIGPASLADVTQQGFHDLVHFNNKQLGETWRTQLHNEPGLVLTYERKWKIWQSTMFGLETDAIPEVGLTVGNIFTYAEVGGMVRIGRDLGVDYGIPRMRPSLSGTAWFDADRITSPWGWYLFAGLQGRAVARNIFLDGNTFRDSLSVEKEILVGDASIGGSLFYKDLFKVDYTMTIRSNEYTKQPGPDRYGTVSLSWRF